MPGYTHLQRAQPVYLGHHLLAYFWMLERDAIRFDFARRLDDGDAARLRRARRAQLGPRPRRRPPTSSASRGPSPNSIDAVSNRDFALDYMYAATVCATHLSRLGIGDRDLVEPASSASASPPTTSPPGSSLMPQKKNPDAAELLRAKSPRVAGLAGDAASASCTRCRSPTPRTCRRTRRRSSTPSTRSSSASRRPSGCSPGCASTASGSPPPPADEMVAATDVADLLVRKGMPFREAHGVVGGLVRAALESGRALSELDRERARASTPSCSTTSTTRCCARARGWTRSSRPAAPARARLAEQLEAARRALSDLAAETG